MRSTKGDTMKRILMALGLLISTTLAQAYPQNIENILLDAKNNLDNENYYIQLGTYIKENKDQQLIIKEALRHAAIVNSQNRDKILDLMTKSTLINQQEKVAIENQVNIYQSIVFDFKKNVAGIDINKSYTGYDCKGIESRIYDLNTINPFKRGLRISDVSAYQDFLQFFNNPNVVITTIPSAKAVIDYVKQNTKVKFINLEEKLIANNATAVSMYTKVSDGRNTYLMFPYRLYPYEASNLSELTMMEYAYFALNLKLVGRLTPEIYQTFTKIYRRNAAFCLYSNR